MKTCRICKEPKEDICFQKNRRVCKTCRNEQSKEALRRNPERLLKLSEYRKQKRKENSELTKQKDKEYKKIQRERDPKGFKKRRTKAVSKWKDKNRDKFNEYTRTLYHTNQKYRLGKLIRNRIREFLSGKKRLNTKELLGCSYEFLKKHLQNTAISNGYLDFDINNYDGDKYHIDHIKPCVSFDLTKEDEQRKCFHWSNLQILSAEENLIKGIREEIYGIFKVSDRIV